MCEGLYLSIVYVLQCSNVIVHLLLLLALALSGKGDMFDEFEVIFNRNDYLFNVIIYLVRIYLCLP